MSYNGYTNYNTWHAVAVITSDEYTRKEYCRYRDYESFRFYCNGMLDVIEEEYIVDFWADDLDIDEINEALYGEE